MKKILFYLTIAWAIFSLNSVDARGVKLGLGIKIAQQEYVFGKEQSNDENLFIDECLEDIFDDDDSKDSKKKKNTSRKTAYTKIFFAAQYFSTNTSIKTLPQKRTFPLQTSLLTFMCIWRI